MSVAVFFLLFFFSSNGQHWTRPVSAARPWLWLLNMWEMLEGSSLSPDSLFTWSVRRWRRPPRQIYHLLDLSLPPSPPSSRLRSLALVCLIFFHFITNADQKKKGERRNNDAHTYTHTHRQTQTLGLHNKSFLLVRTQGSVKDGSSLAFFFFF